MRRRPSIEDIARAAGVANSTVSRALRDSPLISSEVRATIQRIASEMGYTPNGIAQSLQTQRSNTIGLVVVSIADPFFADVANGVEEIARAAGMSVFLSASSNDPSQQLMVIETFQQRRVDGIIVADSQLNLNHQQRLMRVDVPTVLINSQADHAPDWLCAVGVDDYYGASMAVSHLLELGHRKIGYIGLTNRLTSNRQRMRAYHDLLVQAGCQPREEWLQIAHPPIASSTGDVELGRSLLKPLLDAGVTAVFCYNDMVAIGVLMACRELGLQVPQDLSVVGYDDIAMAGYISPPLTTVSQPKRGLGRIACQKLLDVIEGKSVDDHILMPSFVLRESTGSVAEHR
jgi:DNA-binding LacI/PurR family transcriptional regulator